jgi:acetolactate synthase-1/2/3 large subunit
MATVADFMVKWIEAEKLPYIFGVPGGQNGAIYDALFRNRAVKSVLVRHEQNAAFMADALARVTGSFGACLATVGPGALNLLSGLAIAYADSTPVLAITGDAPIKYPKRKGQREDDVNQLSLFKNVTKWNAEVVKAEHIPDIMATAFRNMFSGRPGPVHINVPMDVLATEFAYDPEAIHPESTRSKLIEPCCPDSAVAEVAKHILATDKIVIFADGLALKSGAGEEVERLAGILNAPVVTTYKGRGIIPEVSLHAFGIPGAFGNAETNKVLMEAKMILSLGVQFDEFSTSAWTIPPKSTPLIQIDVDGQEIGKNYPVLFDLIGNIKAILKRLIYFLEEDGKTKAQNEPWWLGYKKQLETRLKNFASESAVPLNHYRIYKEVRDFFDESCIATFDVGTNKQVGQQVWKVYRPQTCIMGGRWGHMGYGFPASLAAKLVKPKSDVVCFIGDGGFMMTAQELATAVKYNLPILICLFNDSALSMVKHSQKIKYEGRIIDADLVNPNFAEFARSFGAYGHRVEKPEDIPNALLKCREMMNQGKPCLIEFIVDAWETRYRGKFVF